MKKILIFLIVSLQIVAAQVPQARGVWLSREVIEAGPDLIEKACHRLTQANFNRIFVNVYYLGGTIYPSDVVEQAGGPRQLSRFWGRDPLAETIEIAHRWNLEVIAWFEYGLMNYYSGNDTSNSGPIFAAHPDWEAIDHQGRHYLQNDWGVFHWMDPAHPEVQDFIAELFAEIAARYPQLDGIETDRIRYPSSDFSYSDTARALYQQQTGGTDPLQIFPGHPEWNQWAQWREKQINQIAKRIYHSVKALRPGMLLSAAVVPPYSMSTKLQRWDVWSDSGYVDALEPMLYLNDSDYPSQFELAKQRINPAVLLYAGVDFKNQESLIYQVNYALSHQADGVTIWYYEDLSDEVLQALHDELFKEKSVLPHRDLIIDDGASKYFSYSGSWEKQTSGFNGSSLLSSDSQAQAVFWAPVWLSGNYAIFARWPALPALTDQAVFELEINGTQLSINVNQQNNQNRWMLLHSDSLNYGAKIQVQLSNNGNGALAADALRILKQKPLKAIDYFTPDSTHLNLKFNQWIDSASAVVISNYTFEPPVDVLNVSFSAEDRAALILETSPFLNGQTYSLNISGLKNDFGLPFNDLNLSFTFNPQLNEVIVDNTANTFIANGSWQTVQDTCGINGEWLYIESGTGNKYAQWWTNLPQDGYYQVQAFIPCSNLEFTQEAQYTVLHNFGVQTLSINQQAAVGGWADLGTFYFNTEKTASVKVSDLSSTGVIAADAIRFKRTFNPTLLPKTNQQSLNDFKLGNNYPNPFNNQTVIPIYLSQKAKVKLDIFDVCGRRIRSLPEQLFSAGQHQIKLTADQMSSGVYFYVVRFKGGHNLQKTAHGKMILLK